ncbi:unnamed protein product [Haemonchus placei]|uniref:Ovule protein n=1 Tax=Haemonchus placei TaxID=6290 RepID=A0A0N4WJX0_HAEPC|nr:unnamed protein product [Haemonchus placei]
MGKWPKKPGKSSSCQVYEEARRLRSKCQSSSAVPQRRQQNDQQKMPQFPMSNRGGVKTNFHEERVGFAKTFRVEIMRTRQSVKGIYVKTFAKMGGIGREEGRENDGNLKNTGLL